MDRSVHEGRVASPVRRHQQLETNPVVRVGQLVGLGTRHAVGHLDHAIRLRRTTLDETDQLVRARQRSAERARSVVGGRWQGQVELVLAHHELTRPETGVSQHRGGDGHPIAGSGGGALGRIRTAESRERAYTQHQQQDTQHQCCAACCPGQVTLPLVHCWTSFRLAAVLDAC